MWSGSNTLITITEEFVVRPLKMHTQFTVSKIDTRQQDINNYNKPDFKKHITSCFRCVCGGPPDTEFATTLCNPYCFYLVKFYHDICYGHLFGHSFIFLLFGFSSLFSSFPLSEAKPRTIIFAVLIYYEDG